MLHQVLTSIEAAQSAALDAEGQAKAKYNFTGQSAVELSLKKVSLTSKFFTIIVWVK